MDNYEQICFDLIRTIIDVEKQLQKVIGKLQLAVMDHEESCAKSIDDDDPIYYPLRSDRKSFLKIQEDGSAEIDSDT